MTDRLTTSQEDFWTEAAQLSSTASSWDSAYLSSLRKILSGFNNIWLMDEQFFQQPGRPEDEAKCGLMSSSGCPAHGRLLLTNPRRHGTAQVSRHCPDSKDTDGLIWIPTILTKPTSNFSAVGRNGIWGVNSAPVQRLSDQVRLGCCSHTGLCCSWFFKGMADIRVKKWNTQNKL